MTLRSCSFLQWFALFEPVRQGRVVSLARVKMQALPSTNPCPYTAKGHAHDCPIF